MRTLQDILGADKAQQMLGEPSGGVTLAAVSGAAPGGSGYVNGSVPGGQVNSVPLGSQTGAPPNTQLKGYQVVPYGAVGRGQSPTLIVEADRANRVAIITAPFVGFSVYVGTAGVKPGDLSIPPGLPYEVILPGGQELYAVTDAPVYLPLRVQIAAVLVGERERAY